MSREKELRKVIEEFVVLVKESDSKKQEQFLVEQLLRQILGHQSDILMSVLMNDPDYSIYAEVNEIIEGTMEDLTEFMQRVKSKGDKMSVKELLIATKIGKMMNTFTNSNKD